MNREYRPLARGAGSAANHKCTAVRNEFRFKKQFSESRVGLIGPPAQQTHLGVARQLEFGVATAMIDQRHRAQLRICIRHHTNGTAGLDVAIPSTKLGAVSVKLEFRVIGGLPQGLAANRPVLSLRSRT